MLGYLFSKFRQPFKSTLFNVVFFTVFIPIGTFGVYYESLSPNSTEGFFETVNPSSLFTYIVPLLVSVAIDGTISIFNRIKTVDTTSYEYTLLRDSSIVGIVSIIVCILFMYLSLAYDSIVSSISAMLITWTLWIILSSGKEEFTPTSNWRPSGDSDVSNKGAITNG